MLLVDLELTEPLVDIAVPDDREGLALIVRHRGRPVGFVMERLAPGSVLSADEVDHRLGRACGPDLLGVELLENLESTRLTHPDAAPTSLTVAICTKDGHEGLDRVLRSLHPMREEAVERDIDLEILVIDNASEFDCVGQVAGAHGLSSIREDRPGLDFARNRALAEVTTEWLAFFDDDVVVDPTWLAGFDGARAAHPDAAAFAGLVLPLRLDTDAQVLFERRGGFRQGFVTRRLGREHPSDPTYPAGAGNFGTGANMVVAVEVARELGGFDEALDAGAPMPGGGDLDLWYRLVRAGRIVVYEPTCVVFHDHRESLDALERQFRESWGRSFHAFIDKCYRSDPAMRPAHRRYLWRWYRSMLSELARSAAGRSEVPPRFLAGELQGAVRGMAGDYRRAVRRAAAVRGAHR